MYICTALLRVAIKIVNVHVWRYSLIIPWESFVSPAIRHNYLLEIKPQALQMPQRTLKLQHLVSICTLFASGPVERLITCWTVRGSNPSGSESFRTCPDWLWGLFGLLYNGYHICFPGLKRPWRGFDYPSPSSADVKIMIRAIVLLPPLAFMACSRVNFTFFTFTLLRH